MRINPNTWLMAGHGNIFCKALIVKERIRRIERFRKERPFDVWLVHLLKRVKHPTYTGSKT